VDFEGEHLSAQHARLWDVPDEPPPIGVAVSGPEGAQLAGERADAMIAVQPDAELGRLFDAAGDGRTNRPRIGQVALSYDTDAAVARKRAHEQFRWFASGWPVMAELPGPGNFAAAAQSVREEDVAEQVPCGDDVDAHVEAVRKFVDAGFTHVALVQVGGDVQDPFLDWAEAELLPALRQL
jgi:G6PDH family F420-dependent oxidoreductase